MQPLGAILLGVLLTAAGQAPARGAPGPPEPSPIAPALARYEQLPVAARERWVREMLVRLDRANAVVLARDEAARQRARTEKFARLVAGGYRPPRSSLENLLRELTRREQQAVESLARRYRIQIYRTFRQQEEVFRGRKGAWDRVEAAWRAAGGPIEPQHQMIDWLVVATYRSTPGTIGALPGVPNFGPQIGLPGAWPGRLAEPGRPREPALPWTVLRPELPPRRSPVPPPPASPPRDPRAQAALAGDWLLPAPTRPEPPPAELAAIDAARVGARPRVRPLQPGETAAEVADGAPRVAAIPVRPLPEPSGPAPADTASRPGPTAPITVEQPAVPENGSAMGDWLLPPRRGSAERTDQPPAHEPTAGQARSPARSGLGAPHAPGGEPVPGPQVASAFPPSEWPAFPVEPPAPRPPAPRPPAPPDRPAEPTIPHGVASPDEGISGLGQPPEPRVRVNLNELAAGIAGANLALRALEAELDNEMPPAARDLASLVDRLEILVLRHDDLALFCELITPEEQRRAGRLESPRALIPRLANKVFELRSRATGREFTGTEPERELELKILADLSRQLAEMADER